MKSYPFRGCSPCRTTSYSTLSRRSAGRLLGALLALTGVLAIESDAAITFSNATRSVSSSNDAGSSELSSSVALEVFDSAVSAGWSEYWPSAGEAGSYQTNASQDSRILVSGFRAVGSVSGTGSFYFLGAGAIQQTSTSFFQVNFNLNAPASLSLVGSLRLAADVGGTNYDLPEVWVTLSGKDGEIFSQGLSEIRHSGVQTASIDQMFSSLEAGDYSLTAFARTVGNYSAGGLGGDGSASFDLAMGHGADSASARSASLIPEPSSLLMACIGCSLLFVRRVKRD